MLDFIKKWNRDNNYSVRYSAHVVLDNVCDNCINFVAHNCVVAEKDLNIKPFKVDIIGHCKNHARKTHQK
jgi:hypothetical protein